MIRKRKAEVEQNKLEEFTNSVYGDDFSLDEACKLLYEGTYR